MNSQYKPLAITLIALSLAGCIGDSAEITKAKTIIKEKLIDGESAQFFDMQFYKKTNYVCGKVNAKNKLGGYVGKKLIAVDLNDSSYFQDPDRETPSAPTAPSYTSMSSTMDYLMRSSAWQAKVASIRENGELFDLLIKYKCSENPPPQEKSKKEPEPPKVVEFNFTEEATQIPKDFRGSDLTSVLVKVKEIIKKKEPVETTEEFNKRMSTITYDPSPLSFEILYSIKLENSIFSRLNSSYNADKEEMTVEINKICSDDVIFKYKNTKPLICEFSSDKKYSISNKNKIFGKYLVGGKIEPYVNRQDYNFIDKFKIKRDLIPSLYSPADNKEILIDVLIVGTLVNGQNNPIHTWVENAWLDKNPTTSHAIVTPAIPFDPKFLVYYNRNSGEILLKREIK